MTRLLPILLLAACASDPTPRAVDPTPRVSVVAAVSAPETLERTVLSTVEARHDAWLTPLRGGRVRALPVSLGDAVGSGDVLVQLDDREARANVAAARAAEAEAEAVLADATSSRRRIEALGESATEAQLDQAATGVARAEAALERARAQAQLARVNLEHMALRAPFDGAVAWLDVDLGESVGTSSPVARVVDASAGRVEIDLLEDELSGAREGEAGFLVRRGPHEAEARLEHLAPAADPRTGGWRAELVVDDPALPPGTPVEVTLRLPRPGGEVILPATALEDGTVWRLEGDTVRRQVVRVVAEAREGLVIEGIDAGAEVVLHHAEPLEDGATVVRLEAP